MSYHKVLEGWVQACDKCGSVVSNADKGLHDAWHQTVEQMETVARVALSRTRKAR